MLYSWILYIIHLIFVKQTNMNVYLFGFDQFKARDMVFNVTFHNISALSLWYVLVVEDPGVPGEHQRPVIVHWQTLSHNVISSTPRHERDFNSQI